MFLPGYARNPKSYMRIKWTIDGWPWVDPLKDLKASTGLVRSGFSSRTQEVAERGLDVEALEEEIQADNERADAAGLVFDSDAREQGGRNQGAGNRQREAVDSGNTDEII
jgi:capsid protein